VRKSAARLSRGDPNAYSWGKIGKHYVVVAALPSGEYGLMSTATVAQGLHPSLPHVRIGLLVGIGAGVREIVDEEDETVGKRDIRLCDVIVSHPEGTVGGVVQSDLVKAKTVGGSQVLERKGSLNSPPLALRSALTKLQATHIKRGTTIPTIIEEAFERYPNMRLDFCHPGLGGTEIDRRTDTYHSRGGTTTSNEARASPKIHYGTIASSNTLEKSARHRDAVLARLAKENIKPMCFEMEAAGLVNNFPCLVIRGTCDYGDEHKNDDWQNYAAVTAAGFAKEFLRCVDVQEIQETQEIGNLILQSLGTLHQAVERNREDVSHLKMSADAHRRSHILDWLCSDDYSTQFETRRAKHLRETGQWFLEDRTFLNWIQADQSSTLICPGGPGCGKTTISTLVIDHLRSASGLQKPVIHFFFDYQRQAEQTVDDFVATLLRQLASLSQEVFSAVEKLHNRFVFQSRRPSLDDLQSELRSAFLIITGVFVVIDAWDECESVKRAECANMLRGCLSHCVVHLLATTRDNHEVRAFLDGDLTLRIRASAEDLTLYARTRAVDLPPNIKDNEELVKNVIEGVIDASDGVFLLARLHMNSIQDHLTANEIKGTLTELRKDIGSYSSVYKATMERISGQERRHGLAMRILARVVHAKRPLSFGELNHALATRPGKRSIDGDDTYAKDVILSVCAGLITLDDTYRTPVRLIHYTAQEYLFDTWMQWFPTESADIVDVCLTYLSFDEFKYPCLDWQTLSSRHYHYTLFEYAAQNWAYHFKDRSLRRKGDCTTTQMALGFLLHRFSVCSAVQALDRLSPDGYDLLCHGIHLAAYLGLEDLTMLLIAATRVETYLEDIGLRKPLWWAARQGQADVVRALLGTKRVNVNRKDYYRGEWRYTDGQTPLAAAAGNGHEEVVKVLLATERTVFDTRDLQGRSPLSYAAKNGHKNIVKILLDTGAFNISETNNWRSWTPLSCAAANGHEGVIKMLLTVQGIDVNCKDHNDTPLYIAVRHSHEGAVKAS
ncbi:hypothetical protein D6D05_04621, partial [Aureobasidium pullulans]